MKFNVSSTELLKGLMNISKAIPAKSALPILENFLFNLNGNILEVTASDSELTLRTEIEVDTTEEEGMIAVPARHIIDLLKELPDQPVSIRTASDTSIECNWTTGNSVLPFFPAEDYPEIKGASEDAEKVVFPAKSLIEGINSTVYATADDEIRPVMTGIYFDFTPENLVFVGTDGRKLVRSKTTAVTSAEQVGFILPKKPANILKGLLSKGDAQLELAFSDKLAVVKAPEFTLTCRLIDGRYPNYNSVIPQNNPYRAVIDRPALISTLKRVLVFCNQSSALVKLALTQNQLTVSGQDVDYSTSAEEHLICEYDAPAINIGFKGTLLLDILNNLDSAEVQFELADPGRAGIITPAEQKEGEEVLMLLMPMMLND